MTGFFRREIAAYAAYHRDERNALTHIFGIPIIFVSVVLPLDPWTVGAFGMQTSAANILVAAVLVVWLLLDAGVGLALVAATVVLMLIAAAIVGSVGTFAVWLIAAVLFAGGWALQILGHAKYEHRRPALLDNPVHLLIGPMFIMAKLLVALGLRPDLDAIIAHSAPGEPRSA
jgi:uncharacterized membrane protein YGL010W